MKCNRIALRHKALIFTLGLTLCLNAMAPRICAALDAYVLYSGKNSQEKLSFLATLPKEVSVKSYNVDRLSVGDYSERQKALSKFKKASAVVLLLDEPMKVLGDTTLSRDLIIVQSLMTSVKSDGRTLYVLSQDMDFAQLGKHLKILNMENQENLQKKELQAVDIVLVNEKTLHVIAAASLVTANFLNPQ